MSRAVKFGPVHAHPAYDVSRATSRGVSVGVFVAGSRESAGNQVAHLREQYPGAAVEVTFRACCPKCDGSGRVGRARMRWVACTACQGTGDLYAVRLTDAEVDALEGESFARRVCDLWEGPRPIKCERTWPYPSGRSDWSQLRVS